jgi:hypothetical protein
VFLDAGAGFDLREQHVVHRVILGPVERRRSPDVRSMRRDARGDAWIPWLLW